jgi:hypothetical protein
VTRARMLRKRKIKESWSLWWSMSVECCCWGCGWWRIGMSTNDEMRRGTMALRKR